MTTRELEALAQRYGVFLCVECGKCSAVCPMGDLFDDYRYETSPRGFLEKALLGLDVGEGDDVWSCLTCNLCTSLCPQGVQVRDFVVAARGRALAAGHDEHAAHCRGCGTYLGPAHTGAHLERVVGTDDEGLLHLCLPCKRAALARRVRSL